MFSVLRSLLAELAPALVGRRGQAEPASKDHANRDMLSAKRNPVPFGRRVGTKAAAKPKRS